MDDTVEEVADRFGEVGDAFMDVARRFSLHGRMSEQIDRLVHSLQALKQYGADVRVEIMEV